MRECRYFTLRLFIFLVANLFVFCGEEKLLEIQLNFQSSSYLLSFCVAYFLSLNSSRISSTYLYFFRNFFAEGERLPNLINLICPNLEEFYSNSGQLSSCVPVFLWLHFRIPVELYSAQSMLAKIAVRLILKNQMHLQVFFDRIGPLSILCYFCSMVNVAYSLW